jgi:hypothetical protein
MYTGMMRLLYSAARAFMATDSGKFRDEVTPALSGAEAASKIAELFSRYSEEKIATAQAFPATELQKGWANAIAQHSEVFLLIHELSHIYNEHSFWRHFRQKRPVRELEEAADSTAAAWVIEYLINPTPNGPQRQMFYAGAEFGLRVRMAMETIGMRFATTHPPAGDRIAALRAKLKKAAGIQNFYAIASTSLAFDQMWRAIEQILLHKPPDFESTLDDVLSSMRTKAVELLKAGKTTDIEIRQVGGDPRTMQAVFAPKEPSQLAMLNSAHSFMQKVRPEVQDAARQHAGDLFEKGTTEFSLLYALLDLGLPSVSAHPAYVPLPFIQLKFEQSTRQ